MDIIVDNSKQWDYISRMLSESPRRSDKMLCALVPTLKQMIERDRYGELLVVTDAKHPYQFLGAAAITMQCCCVKVLMQVVSKDCLDQTAGKQALAQAITQFAVKYQCTLIFVHIPESSGFDCEHRYYEARAESVYSQPTVELGTITYVLSVDNL